MRIVLFTKLESSISQRRVHITYKIDSGADGNLMPFKIFKTLFSKPMKYKNIMILYIEKLGMCMKSMMHPYPFTWKLVHLVSSLGARLLQVRKVMNCGHDEVQDNVTLHPSAFVSKSFSSAEWQYSNIEQEILGLPHGLKKFHHHCFAKGSVCVNRLQTIGGNGKKEVATLSQHLQCIMLCIYQ